MRIVTCVAPVNIAVIKYWGKSDEELIIPLNESLSSTLNIDTMCAKTTILSSPLLKENKFWLNGKEQTFDNNRLTNCLKEVKNRADPSLLHFNWNISICSENNFPTAAGLASSAAGYACLVYALSKLYEIKGDISSIARRGSGSACRSVFGGWVQWCKGSSAIGTDCIARQIFAASHWPEMRILILVVNDTKKKYSSTFGMRKSVETSDLLRFRSEKIVPKRIGDISEAIRERNFGKFGEITMRDSNQFHAICLDTFPPCCYLNETSRAIIDLVHCYNDYKKSIKVAYTFDAGPNACIYMLDAEVDEFISVVNYFFPPASSVESVGYFRGIPLCVSDINEKVKESLNIVKQEPGALKYIIQTNVGDGPRLLENEEDHLLNEHGEPKFNFKLN